MSKKKHLVLWISDQEFKNKEIFDSYDFIEVQDASLALQFIKVHAVSILIGSPEYGTEFYKILHANSPATSLILYLQEINSDRVVDFINTNIFHAILTSMDDFVLRSAIAEAETQLKKNQLRKESSQQLRELESLNESLELNVAERTAHIEQSKKEEEDKLGRVRSLIRFIKELGLVLGFEELLQLLRIEIKKIAKVSDPILIIKNQRSLTIYYFQQGTVSRLTALADVQFPEKNAYDSLEVRKYLANLFDRPFLKTISIPLKLNESARGLICIEYSQSDSGVKKTIEFMAERSESISIVMDRILLESEFTETAFRWEKTFDSFSDPIAIIDLSYKILRSNKSFGSKGSKESCYKIFADREKPCELCPLADSLASKSPKQSIIKSKNKEYQLNCYPIALSDGKATNVVNHYVDVTKSRELYMKMLQSEKMGALGVLAGNIAHELNNPLTGLRSLAQVLLSQLSTENTIYSDLLEIEKAAARSQKIIKNLKEFSERKSEFFEKVSLDEIVEKTVPMLKSVFRSHRVSIHLNTKEHMVNVDPQLLQQVIFNLINNACQAMQKSGSLDVHTSYNEYTDELILVVKDTGPGIPIDLQKKVFEPFFTTKKDGMGTGLGLSLSKEIIESFNGRIVLFSQPEQGAEFRVFIPVYREGK